MPLPPCRKTVVNSTVKNFWNIIKSVNVAMWAKIKQNIFYIFFLSVFTFLTATSYVQRLMNGQLTKARIVMPGL